ncbi:MAG TPA: tripartite tricarboxylate transporter substrate binding protein [Burkholderiales bacterium]|nr:tripartite tricarboxylate transporter substrate binding protein [Burkholderiales bacterium]
MRRTLYVSALLVALMIDFSHARAQPAMYPTKPLRVIVPFAPGGPSDIFVRAIGPRLTEAWGQPVVIDNRGGAGGVIGIDMAARAAPDGYTILLGASGALVINPAFNVKLPYDSFRDLAPITLVVVNPQLLVFHPSLAANSVKELIQTAKARPGQLNYASVGAGSSPHMGMEMLKAMAGISLTHVPYKGTAPALTDLLGGQVSLMFTSMATVLPQVRAGKLKGIAVGSGKRSPAVPEIPTVAESGVPGFDYVTWFAFYAPAGTPADIIAKLNREFVRILADPQIAKYFSSQGAEPSATTPAGLAAYMRTEHERWKKLIKSANIKIE